MEIENDDISILVFCKSILYDLRVIILEDHVVICKEAYITGRTHQGVISVKTDSAFAEAQVSCLETLVFKIFDLIPVALVADNDVALYIHPAQKGMICLVH